MIKYKLNNGNPCEIKMCDCVCEPSDKSITLAKLATETVEWVLNRDHEDQPPAVVPILNVEWKNIRTGEIVNDLNIVAERGDSYEWSGSYMWNSLPGYSIPYTIESNVFDTLTNDGVLSNVEKRTVNSDTTFNIKFYSVNGQHSEVTSRITFNSPVLFGILGKDLTKMLAPDAHNTVSVNTELDEYFVYKYSIDLPKLEMIALDGALNVILAFDYSEEEFVTDSGIQTKLRVYTSANPGAFTNIKLSFK